MTERLFVTEIQRFSLHDGPGIRTTIFLKGCNLSCRWCHNPETQFPGKQLQFFKKRCIRCGACAAICGARIVSMTAEGPVTDPKGCILCGDCVCACYSDARSLIGEELTKEQLLEILEADRGLFGEQGGVTFSGGEPMLQIEALTAILPAVKEKGYHVTIDTAGCVPMQSFLTVQDLVDLFLYDIKLIDSEKHRVYTGQDNKNILENLKGLMSSGKSVWIRVPLIHRVNDTKEDLRLLHRYLKEIGKPKRLDLLPYHAYGNYKAASIGELVETFETPSDAYLEEIKTVLEDTAEMIRIF